MSEYRWVTCNRNLSWSVAAYRHLVPRGVGRDAGHLGTLCGASGMPASVWRGDSRKPECPECVKVAEATDPV